MGCRGCSPRYVPVGATGGRQSRGTDIWEPALAASLTVTPEGEPGHLVGVYEELVALREG